MKFLPTKIPDVILVKPDIYQDDRGYFMESYHQGKYEENGISVQIVQDNQAGSIRNVLRGLHYQVNHPQGKLIGAVTGKIFDVAVDIRKDSKTLGQWVGAELSQENKHRLYIPPGFAHGYCVLSEYAEIEYKCTDIYHPEDDRGILWDDPALNINWPVSMPILSVKDRNLHLLKDAELL